MRELISSVTDLNSTLIGLVGCFAMILIGCALTIAAAINNLNRTIREINKLEM